MRKELINDYEAIVPKDFNEVEIDSLNAFIRKWQVLIKSDLGITIPKIKKDPKEPREHKLSALGIITYSYEKSKFLLNIE